MMAMSSDLLCTQCEKIVVEVESVDPILHLHDTPNTFDPAKGTYIWKEFDVMKYALVPRTAEYRKAWIELYLCLDEDDLDDIDLVEYAKAFLAKEISPRWPLFTVLSVGQPVLATPDFTR